MMSSAAFEMTQGEAGRRDREPFRTPAPSAPDPRVGPAGDGIRGEAVPRLGPGSFSCARLPQRQYLAGFAAFLRSRSTFPRSSAPSSEIFSTARCPARVSGRYARVRAQGPRAQPCTPGDEPRTARNRPCMPGTSSGAREWPCYASTRPHEPRDRLCRAGDQPGTRAHHPERRKAGVRPLRTAQAFSRYSARSSPIRASSSARRAG